MPNHILTVINFHNFIMKETDWSFPENLQDWTCPPSQESKAFNQKMDEPLILSASPPWMLASKPWRADELAVIILYHTILCRHHVIFGCLGEDRVGGRDQLSQTLISPPPYYAASTRKSSLDHDMLHQDILHHIILHQNILQHVILHQSIMDHIMLHNDELQWTCSMIYRFSH